MAGAIPQIQQQTKQTSQHPIAEIVSRLSGKPLNVVTDMMNACPLGRKQSIAALMCALERGSWSLSWTIYETKPCEKTPQVLPSKTILNTLYLLLLKNC